jgi:AhpC/TSA family.
MPHFEHVQKIYGDKIEMIGISLGLNDDLQAVNSIIEEFNLTMPMAIDRNGDLAQKFRLIGTPYHLVFDKHMNLIHKGHDADQSLDNKLSLIAQTKTSATIDSSVLIENESNISVNVNDGKVHALFFTATWCDWYLKDSRPKSSKACAIDQKNINTLYSVYPEYSWLGAVSRLWTGDKDLLEYQKNIPLNTP